MALSAFGNRVLNLSFKLVMSQSEIKEYAGDVTPEQAWNLLEANETAVLIDCRTDAEWCYVGKPDLSRLGRKQHDISWKIFPAMDVNQYFAEQISLVCPSKDTKLLFLKLSAPEDFLQLLT